MAHKSLYEKPNRRMYLVWLPLMTTAVAGVYITAPMPSGLSLLLTIVAGMIAFGAVADWCTAELKALKASATR